MKNYVQDGNVLTLIAPYAVSAGDLVKVGSIVGVATSAADNGAPVEVLVVGVVDVPKATADAFTVGALVYLDDANHVATTTSNGNALLGVAVAVAANPSAVARLRLNGSFA